MELSAYIHDAWANEQANQTNLDGNLLTWGEIDHEQWQIDQPVWNSTTVKWRSYLLSAIAITGINSFNLGLSYSVQARQFLEPSVNAAPWCEALYLCNTSYILEVQTLLVQRGFAAGEIDGVYGRHTKRAVVEFQKSQRDLVVDGIPGGETLALLRNSSGKTPVIPLSNDRTNQLTDQDLISSDRQITIVRSNRRLRDAQPFPQLISQSNKAQNIVGSEVGNLQILLKQRGFYQGEIDGRLGKTTTEAILRAQEAYNLPTDGFAGPLTIRALLAGGTNVPLSLPAFDRSPVAKDVLEIQQLLKARGFYDSDINGRLNLQTRESIFNAQNAYGHKATGEITPELMASLKGQNLDSSTAQNVPDPNDANTQEVSPPSSAPNNPQSKSTNQNTPSNQDFSPQLQPSTNSS